MTVTAATGALDAAAWPARATEPQPAAVERVYGRAALVALDGELGELAVSSGAPLTGRPTWSLATSAASDYLQPWALLARDESGTPIGAVVLLDHIQDPRAVLTTLAGTDGGHRGTILTGDAVVAHALGDAVRRALDDQSSPSTVVLGPLPAGCPIVHAFATGLAGSRQDAAAPIPVIRRDAGTDPESYLAHGMRRALRKASNRLKADGRHAEIRFTSDAEEILGMLPQLEQVHRHRDHVHGRISDLDDGVRHQTWRHRVRQMTDIGVLELAMLDIDGELAAYTMGVVDGPVYRLLEGRFVTEWARYSPGRLLEVAVVERVLADEALTTFDWMTAIAPETLLGQNDEDPMVLLQVG